MLSIMEIIYTSICYAMSSLNLFKASCFYIECEWITDAAADLSCRCILFADWQVTGVRGIESPFLKGKSIITRGIQSFSYHQGDNK